MVLVWLTSTEGHSPPFNLMYAHESYNVQRYFVPICAYGIPRHNHNRAYAHMLCHQRHTPSKIKCKAPRFEEIFRVWMIYAHWLDEAYVGRTKKNRKQISQYFISIMNADFFVSMV